jgi:hypothetical protein
VPLHETPSAPAELRDDAAIVRRAAALGYDPFRVAVALGRPSLADGVRASAPASSRS